MNFNNFFLSFCTFQTVSLTSVSLGVKLLIKRVNQWLSFRRGTCSADFFTFFEFIHSILKHTIFFFPFLFHLFNAVWTKWLGYPKVFEDFFLLTLYWLTSEVHVDIGSRHSFKTFRLKYYQSFSDPFFLLLLRKSYPQKALALLADQNPIGILFGTDFLLTDTGGCGHDVINAHLSLCLGFIWYIIHLYLRRKALKGVLRKGLSLDVLLI